MSLAVAPQKADLTDYSNRAPAFQGTGRPEVILLHPSESDQGGIMAATIFYAAALIEAGHSTEIWTPSPALQSRAAALGVPVFLHKGLRNSAMPLVHPAIVGKALQVRGSVRAVLHQGEKHWLLGRLWLRAAAEYVVFHNEKIGQRKFFKNWLALSSRHSEELGAFARSRSLNRRIVAIVNGPLPDAATLRSPRPVKPIRAIGALSNFGYKKGMDVLVRAFAVALARGCDLRLILAGNGFEWKACRRIASDLGIADKIQWMDWLWDTRPFFDAIDLFCLPSRKEPFGIVVTEAMRAGLAVIATDTSGPRDIVIPGHTGWIVPADSVEALADAICDAAQNPEKTAAFGSAGLERYKTMYSLEAAGRTLAQALEL